MRGVRRALAGNQQEEKKKNPYEQHGLKSTVGEDGITRQTPSRAVAPRRAGRPEEDDPGMFDFDPEIKDAFARNFRFFRRVFSIETILSPLPAPVSRGIARSIFSFTRIFTQFFDQRGIANAQKSLGLRPNDR